MRVEEAMSGNDEEEEKAPFLYRISVVGTASDSFYAQQEPSDSVNRDLLVGNLCGFF